MAIRIPKARAITSSVRLRPKYVSLGTNSASIAVNGGAPVVADLAANSPNCTTDTSGNRTCSIAINAPVGSDTFSEATYASTDGSGTALSQNTTTATIVAGQANTVNLTLDGVVASIVVTLANPNPPQGVATTIPLTVTMNDASGNAIIGNDPFTSTVTLTDSDTSGATTITSPAVTGPATSIALNSPGDAASLSVAYNGSAVNAVFGATAPGVAAANVTTATLSPAQAVGSSTIVDWPTYAFDAQRSGYNPYTTAITPASIPQLHVAWQLGIPGGQTQPIVVTNVAGHPALIVVASYYTAQAYDAFSGQRVWQTALPYQTGQDCGTSGLSGTAVYDKALSAIFVAAGNGTGADPNHVVLYRLDAATGAQTGQVDVTPNLLPGEASLSHTGIEFANGLIYFGTGSNCEGTGSGAYPSWRGRVVAVDPSSMTLTNTFFPTWNQGGTYGGGGVWSWGAVSADPSGNIFSGTGNAETDSATTPQVAAAPFSRTTNEQVGYADSLVKLSSDLSTLEASDQPAFNFQIGYGDLDYSGTPVVITPPGNSGCSEMTATQGKGGLLVVNNAQTLAEIQTFPLSVPSAAAYYSGNPAYSPVTNYIYAAITSSGQGSSLLPPGLAAIGGCGSTIVWHAQFGPDSALYSNENPRSAPTVTAGGVVFMGTPCTPDGNGGCGAPSGTAQGALWAVDATTGTVLNGGKPLLITGANIRMAPSADGLWLWLYDNGGNLYGLTIDPSVKATALKVARRAMPTYHLRHP